VFDAIAASLGYAGGVIADKFVLSKYKVPVMRFIPLLFIWLAIITGIFLSRWGGFKLSVLADWRYMGLFVLMILVAAIWNVLYYQGVQKENLHELELIMLLSPLATIIFATMFLPSEREWGVFIPGIIATFALLATRFRKHHIKIGKTAWRTIAAMLLMSFESILIKELLGVFSPVTLYFARTVVIAVIFLVLYRPKLLSMPRNAFALTILSAVFGVVQMVLKFYGFQSLGVIETTMILILGPFLVYLASAFFFRERLYKRDVFAATVVVMCILYVQFWR
jgi:drug/metabolite transporter (DMT)-like permease